MDNDVRVERKLAAIFAADVQGYSRLMREDEEATLRTLTSHRKLIDSLIVQHRGRIVGTAGDSVLAEFASVVDAVQCAVVIQQTLKAENAPLPAERQMEFRIGINLDDVMVEGAQIYGDGVNIAARLEALAEAGGICISGTVHEQVKHKLALHYEDLGEQGVKNIAEPVRVWRAVMDHATAALAEQVLRRQAQHAREQAGATLSRKNRLVAPASRPWVVGGIGGLLLIVGTLIASRYLSSPKPSPQDSALRTEAAPAALPLPDKPSIVVLPFKNLSGDPEQKYFSDGLTEDLTSDLSKISSLFVISRNTASTYEDKPVKVQEVSKELGVQYVLEGSVRKADGQVRITAQLIDATKDTHLWAERYDRPLKELFALQDEIVQKIVTTLKLQLTLWEQGFLVRKTTDNLEAYDSWLRGMESLLRAVNETKKEANEQARHLFEKALELDPIYAQACASLGATYWYDWFYQWNKDRAQSLERAFALEQEAVALDDSLPSAHRLLSGVYLWKKQHDQAIAEAQRAIDLDPNEADSAMVLGTILAFAGRPKEGVSLIQQAMRLNPRYPAGYLANLGVAYREAGRYEEAITVAKNALIRNPNVVGIHWSLAVCYVELGRLEEARAEVAEMLRLNPNWSLEVGRQNVPFKDPAILERRLDALREAGMK